MGRISIAGLLWFVALIALVIAVFRDASDFWLGATFLTTLGLLCASVLGAVLERSRGGVWWLGFAVFGWTYLGAGLIPGLAGTARIPSDHAARRIFAALDGEAIKPPPLTGPTPTAMFQQQYVDYALRVQYKPRRQANAVSIGHWLFVLIFARAGATVSCIFTKGLPWQRRPSASPVA